jgi:uncharacterized protein (TIGR00296 family)
MEFENKEGTLAVQISRDAVTEYLKEHKVNVPKNVPDKFKMKAGVFTTISTYPARELRGCIGFPEPIYPLIEALVKSAIYAATEDPRFMPVEYDELDHLVFEVSLLTPPALIDINDPDDYFNIIKIGQDGLIAELGGMRGLLLPQVPVENAWDVKTYLIETCLKAGLSPSCWKNKNVKFYRFSGIIFEETEPKGKIVRKRI